MTHSPRERQEPSLPRIVVVGGGVAGLELATALGRQARRGGRFGVTLVDAESSHIWKPMLHTIAAGTRDVYQQQVAYAAQAQRAGFAFQPGAMSALHASAREIEIAPLLTPDGRLILKRRRIGYDALVMAVGSEANEFGTPGVRALCYRIDSRREAESFNLEVRIRLLQCLAESTELPIAIVGGGATGVELAAELVQMAQEAGTYGAPALASRMRITLVESGPRLLAAFPDAVAEGARKRLESLGVRVRVGERVTSVTEDGLVLAGGETVPGAIRVWAAGVKAPDFLGRFDGFEKNSSHQLRVTPGLQTVSDPAVFAIGDCANLQLPGMARALPATAQVAHQQALHLARHLPAWLMQGTEMPAFGYRNAGGLVSLARFDAYGHLEQHGLIAGGSFRGWAAQAGHALLYRAHQSRLHGFWIGGLMWLVDRINGRLRPRIRLD